MKPGCSLRELMTHRKSTGLFSGDVETYCADLEAQLRKGETIRWIVDTTDGRSMSIINRPMPDGGWVVTHEDISDLVRAERQLEYLALHDPLTGLPNRTLFRRELEEVLSRSPAAPLVGVTLLDLDNFKSINDTFGHPVGDDLLKALSNRLQAVIGETDTLARLGGDEFAIVQTMRSPDEAGRLAARINAAMSAPFLLGGRPITTSFSLGVALAPEHGQVSGPTYQER